MKFSTFSLLMAVLVVVLAFDTTGNAGDPAPAAVAEPVQSPIIQRIRERSVSISPGRTERTLKVCGPDGCRTVNRSSVIETAPVEDQVRSGGGLLSRLFGRRSRSTRVSRSFGCLR